MRTRVAASVLVFLLWGLAGTTADPQRLADRHRQIVADYQRILGATSSLAAQAAANRLALDSYRLLLQQAEKTKDLSAEDLRALGACHEALGETDQALAQYRKSLASKETPDIHLALAKALLAKDAPAAEKHFAAAAKLQPGHPDLNAFHLRAAQVLQRQQSWAEAARHLEEYLAYAKVLADRQPGNVSAKLSHEALGKQLDRTRRFAAMTGKPAPALKIQDWAQGTPTDLAKLKGKAVLLDFFAVWSEPSQKRMEFLKQLNSKYASQGLEVVGVGLAYKHRYDPQTDKIESVKDLSLTEENKGIAAFAKKKGVAWRLGIIPASVTDDYGVLSLPHTVLLDRAGNVRAIFLASDAEFDKRLEAEVQEMLKGK